MRVGQPSQTARGAAAYRAMHQTHESAAIFHDPFAERMLDDETRATLDEHAANPSTRGMRLFIVSRSRFSEEALAACVGRGAGQVVVLGAGLDTFSLRNPFLHVRVFEVDFERESLADGLARAGFRRDQPAFFQWLGVVPYLSSEAISSALDFIVSIPNAAVVFDYTEPFENHPPERRANLMATAERAAARGEPWLSFFNPSELAAVLRGRGFTDIEDVGFADLVNRYSPELAEGLQPGPGGHVVRAAR